jgi:uroporphyrinogen-III synthase
LAGDQVAFDLVTELQQHGFRIVQPVVYRMKPATRLSRETVEQIFDGEADAVMLLSPRTADIWVKLVKKHDLGATAARLLHLCLSPAVARRLTPLGALRIETAAAPTLEDMLTLIR